MSQLEIKGVLSKSEDVFFFTLSVPSLNTYTAECKSREEARGSALFEALFELPWVVNVAAEGRAIVIKKAKNSPPWSEAAPQVAGIIRKLHDDATPFFGQEYLDALIEKKKLEARSGINARINQENVNTPLGLKIQEIIKARIAPNLAMHNGRVDLVDLKDGVVYLYFGDGCQGCSQASVTLKDGIEKLLLKEFPEIHTVKDVTDHSAGKNPFFRV